MTKKAKRSGSKPARPVPVSRSEKRDGKKGGGARDRDETRDTLQDARAQEEPTEPPAVWFSPLALKLWKDNPKRASKAEIRGVADSIIAFGFGAPFVAREADAEIIAGHTRLPAVLLLPKLWEKATADERQRWSFDASRIAVGGNVPVRFLPLDEEQAHLLALADNELGADWQGDMLAERLALLTAEERLLAGFVDKAPMPEGDDNVAPLPKKPKSKLGERYELGPHVLVCGDSTDTAAWTLLLGTERLAQIWTDPPFGVEYEGGVTRDPRRAPRGKSGGATIKNDALTAAQLTDFLRSAFAAAANGCAKGAVWYVKAPAGPASLAFSLVLTELGVWRQTLSWVKSAFVFGRSDYHYRHEIIFYGWLPNGSHRAVPDRKQDSVWEYDRNSHSSKSGAVEHPTMTPVPLIERAVENSSKPDDLVGDPFGGSGSTLIACARTVRRARLIELDPKYCDVIRKRWGDFARSAGLEPGSGAL